MAFSTVVIATVLVLKNTEYSNYQMEKYFAKHFSLKIPYQTINRIYERHKNESKRQFIPYYREMITKKTLLEEKELQLLLKELKISQELSLRQLAVKAINEKFASYRTIGRALNKLGLKARIKQKKPKMEKRHVQARLQHAKNELKIQKKNPDYYYDFVCVDESFLCSKRQGRDYYWFNTELGLPKRIKPVKKYEDGARCHSLLIITFNGERKLIKLNKHVNSEYFRQLASRHIVNMEEIQNGGHLVMDNASSHSSKKTVKYLNQKQVLIHKHPAVIPDLNPCENVLAFIKNYIWKKGQHCKSADDVFEIAKIALQTGECEDVIQNCYRSMVRRWKAIVENDRNPTKY